MAFSDNPPKPKDSTRLTIEAAALKCIGDALSMGVEGHDSRKGTPFALVSSTLKFDVGRVFLSTEPINDEGEYFEISCKLRRR